MLPFRVVVLALAAVGSVQSFSLTPSWRVPQTTTTQLRSALSQRSFVVAPALRNERRSRLQSMSLDMVASMDSDTETKEEIASAPLIKYISVEEAKLIDEELMDADTGGYPLATLMETAGQSVAESIYDMYPPSQLDGYTVLVVCGPGNNGGDALVTARRLHHMGYNIEVVYPNRVSREPFVGLVNQLKALDVRVNMGMPGVANGYGLIVDGIFGTGFDAEDIQPPFSFMLKQIRDPSLFGTVPIVSIDIPSGWDPERGPPEETEMRIEPDLLVSLTAPKTFARKFSGMHYLGARYIPPRMNFKHKLNLPPFEGKEMWAPLPPPPPLTEEEEAEEAARLAALDEAKTAASAEEGGGDVPQEVANPLSSFESVAFGGGAAAAPAAAAAAAQGGPGQWPMPDPMMQIKINEASERALRVIGEKRDGWDQQIRQLVAAQLAPLGWTSDYPPDKTTIAKVCFLSAKTLADRGFDNMDVLAEGRSLAEGAFEQEGDMAAGGILRGIAALYGANGEGEMEKMVLEEVERVREEKGFPEDLIPPPQRPAYTFADKWSVGLQGPSDMGEEFEVVVRPNQKTQLLMKAWFAQNDVDPADEGKFEFYVPEQPKTWQSGVVSDPDTEIGATGLLDGNALMVRRKPTEESPAPEETEA